MRYCSGLLLGLSPAVLKVFESGIDLSGAVVREECFAPFFGLFVSFNRLLDLEARLRMLRSSGNVFGGEDDSSEMCCTISWRSREIRVYLFCP